MYDRNNLEWHKESTIEVFAIIMIPVLEREFVLQSLECQILLKGQLPF